MIEFIQSTLGPYYIYIKFVHVLFVMMWVFSTSAAYAFYLLPVFKAWRRNPEDGETIALRNWIMERFDEGATYEHIAFPIVLITGPLLYIVGGWNTSAAWLDLKLLILIGLFIPVEIMDYYMSHFAGNKRKIRDTGDMEKYERYIHKHWWFFLVTTPAVMIYGVLMVFLAVTKPF
ncbi:MAG: hypothetical protein ACR2PS_01950 [Pseudomonadales bacterium]